MANYCDCEKCEARADQKEIVIDGTTFRRCDGCGGVIPIYKDMGGAGFESQTYDHHFINDVSYDKAIKQGVKLELCYGCYVKDFQKAYPDRPVPVPANIRVAMVPSEQPPPA